jgi:O-antigen ligase
VRVLAAAPVGEPFAQRVGRALLGLQLALAPLVFSTRTLEVFEFPKVMLLVAGAVVIATGALALALERGARGGGRAVAPGLVASLRREPLAWGVLLYLASASLSTLTSLSPRTSFWGAHESFFGLVTVAAYGVLYFAVRGLCAQAAHARALLLASSVGVGGAALYALAQFLGLDPVRWTRTHEFLGLERAFGSMGNPNFLGALTAMGVPLLVALALRARRRGERGQALALALVGGVALGALGVSLSRGAWLAGLAGLGVLLLGGLHLAERPQARRRLALAAAGAVLVAALGVALVPRARSLATAMAERVSLSLRSGPQARPVGGLAIAQDPRWALWSAAWDMFREHPFVGVGLDAFQLAYQGRRDMSIWDVEGHRTPGKAHNEALHVLATQGLPGGLALLLIAAGAGVAWRRALRAQAEERELVLAPGAALTAFGVQGLFSFTVAGCGALAVALLALLAALGRPRSGAEAERPAARGVSGTRALALSLAQAGVVALGAAALWLLVARPLWADVAAQSGVVARKTAGVGRGLPDFAEAVRVNPGRDLHWAQLGVAHYELAQAMGALPARGAQLEAAREAFERARALVPVNSYTQGGLARTLAEMSRLTPPLVPRERAYAAFERAMSLDPRNPYWPAEAARVALDVGDLPRVEEWGRRSLALNPDYGPAAWLLGNVELQNVLPLLGASDNAGAAAAFAPVGAALRDAATNKRWYGDDGLRAVCGSQAAAALVAAGRLDEARAAAELATQVDPNFADARFNLGKVYERLGDLARAEHEYRQALRIQPGHPQARRALATLSPP